MNQYTPYTTSEILIYTTRQNFAVSCPHGQSAKNTSSDVIRKQMWCTKHDGSGPLPWASSLDVKNMSYSRVWWINIQINRNSLEVGLLCWLSNRLQAQIHLEFVDSFYAQKLKVVLRSKGSWDVQRLVYLLSVILLGGSSYHSHNVIQVKPL